MSVIRPRPPTDPIHHRPPREWPAEAGDRYREWVRRIDGVRHDLPVVPGAATGILDAYGTLRAHARRRESPLFALLEIARRVRDAVDRVVVIGDGPDRAVVDLLLATCCHPFHDLLPRPDRGGRPRMVTLGPTDDDDRVQGVLDLLASRGGDRLADAWGLIVAGGAAASRTADLRGLLLAPDRGGAGAPTAAAIVAHVVAGPDAAATTIGVPGGHAVALPGTGSAADACLTALLPAAVAGIDVVRVLEGMAAMERRFSEAALEANPVVTFVAVGRSLARPGDAGRRRVIPPPHWPGLVEWEAALGGGQPSAGAAGQGTTITVEQCRRRPFGPDVPPEPPLTAHVADGFALPRADEHTLGQLLSLLRLAAALDRRTG